VGDRGQDLEQVRHTRLGVGVEADVGVGVGDRALHPLLDGLRVVEEP
jgi:hypothetical protein